MHDYSRQIYFDNNEAHLDWIDSDRREDVAAFLFSENRMPVKKIHPEMLPDPRA